VEIRDRRGRNTDRLREERRRHRELIREALREQLVDVISEETIISSSPERIVRVPIRTVREPTFRYGKGPQQGPGGGQGGQGQQGGGQQRGPRGLVGAAAGTEPGQEIYEVDVSMSELIDLLYEDLKLPRLEDKGTGGLPRKRAAGVEGRKRHGIWPRLNRRASAREHIARRIVSRTKPDKRLPYSEGDLRYHRVRFENRPSTNAVVFCLMDVSGSMDQQKKFLCRVMFYLFVEHVRRSYPQVELVFIVHDTAAHVVNEDQFFHRGSSGGTALSSAHKEVLKLMRERYHPEQWNIYVMHCSDGENAQTDNPVMRGEIRKTLEQGARLFAFIEVMGKRYSAADWQKLVEAWRASGNAGAPLIGLPLEAPKGIDEELRALAGEFSQIAFVPIDSKEQVGDALRLILAHEIRDEEGS